MKKIISFVLAGAVFLLSAVNVSIAQKAFAEDTTEVVSSADINYDNFTFTQDATTGTWSVKAADNASFGDTVVIPSQTADGNPVTAIATNGFIDVSAKEVVISEGITTIGKKAFEYCRSLTDVEIPTSITSVGLMAFAYCTSLENISFDTLPEFGGGIFYGCDSLKEAVFPEGITTITSGMFRGCSSLTEVVIPDTVTTIKSYAFAECKNLSLVKIPATVTSLNEPANASVADSTPENSVFSECGEFVDDFDGSLYDDFTIVGEAGSAIETYTKISGDKFMTTEAYNEKIALLARVAELKELQSAGIITTSRQVTTPTTTTTSVTQKTTEVTTTTEVPVETTTSATTIVTTTATDVPSETTAEVVITHITTDTTETTTTVEEPNTDVIKGDVNGDKRVTSDDATIVLKAFAESMISGEEVELDKNSADMDGNGRINSDDSTLILQFFAKSMLG